LAFIELFLQFSFLRFGLICHNSIERYLNPLKTGVVIYSFRKESWIN